MINIFLKFLSIFIQLVLKIVVQNSFARKTLYKCNHSHEQSPAFHNKTIRVNTFQIVFSVVIETPRKTHGLG